MPLLSSELHIYYIDQQNNVIINAVQYVGAINMTDMLYGLSRWYVHKIRSHGHCKHGQCITDSIMGYSTICY